MDHIELDPRVMPNDHFFWRDAALCSPTSVQLGKSANRRIGLYPATTESRWVLGCVSEMLVATVQPHASAD